MKLCFLYQKQDVLVSILVPLSTIIFMHKQDLPSMPRPIQTGFIRDDEVIVSSFPPQSSSQDPQEEIWETFSASFQPLFSQTLWPAH